MRFHSVLHDSVLYGKKPTIPRHEHRFFCSSSSTFLSFILGRGVCSGHVQHRHAADRAKVGGRQVHPHRRHGRHLRRHVSGRQIFHLNFSLPRLFGLIFFLLKDETSEM